jgi:hypothetical protein
MMNTKYLQIINSSDKFPLEPIQMAKVYSFAKIFDCTLLIAIGHVLQPRHVGKLRAATTTQLKNACICRTKAPGDGKGRGIFQKLLKAAIQIVRCDLPMRLPGKHGSCSSITKSDDVDPSNRKKIQNTKDGRC